MKPKSHAGKTGAKLKRRKPVQCSAMVRHHPATWEKLTGTKVYDPDGWRDDGKSYYLPITEAEWNERMMRSTCMHRTGAFHGRAKMPNDQISGAKNADKL